ncbi:uridine diphosphate-N-acetylglucosamine-binding protein YvcK [Oceanobacillus iheyensis]|uniref:Gluconeogenesis factor n=1 Tax=Oceanobacillus iheyensis (strain DSM 14371 / CIP 107618 / JCM 11309 / KCTC 3954 / HTE831) TaxID=221109 RepID=Q8ENL4_OCEIH|nr:YvcK family protein [Oceanobacillus iheyensis]BAC14423.1 hypothetical conserved protein [Oceanobacillus iheyensis HTE831]
MGTEANPKVVAIGGGTGMPVLLRGLKKLPVDLTAIVTVADDGGSTGRIRNEMDIPAPGDIRNVIAALSDAEPMLLELFQHRFSHGNGLSGHSMGNLLLAAMTSVTGNFNNGIKEISRVLNVKGKIYPISNENMSLHAEMEDGEIVSGESNIPLAQKKIKRVFLEPQPVKPLPNAVRAIKSADLIVISPGSLYTSIMPNLIVPQVKEAIASSKAKVVYVCNAMTQDGETTNYSAADHVKAIHDHIGEPCIDAIVVHNKKIPDEIQALYKSENATPVTFDETRLNKMGLNVIAGNILAESNGSLRHDNEKIASLLYNFV